MNEQVIAERVASEFLARKGMIAIRYIKDALSSLGFLKNYFDMQIRDVLRGGPDESIAIDVKNNVNDAIHDLEEALNDWQKVSL